MRIFFALMLLLSSLTYAATAQAADFCAAHAAAESSVDADCSGHNGNAGGTDCPDCTHHCHSGHMFPDTKSASTAPLKTAQTFIPLDDLLHGRYPASLFRPPQQV